MQIRGRAEERADYFLWLMTVPLQLKLEFICSPNIYQLSSTEINGGKTKYDIILTFFLKPNECRCGKDYIINVCIKVIIIEDILW